jgi:flavodoxin
MNTKIIYATMTKHSKKIAEAISKQLNVAAENVKSNPTVENVDLLFIVGGIYGGESTPELIAFVKSLDKNKVKKAALITSCVSLKSKQATVRQSLNDNGIEVIDEFICQGNFLVMGLGHPNNKDIQDAVEFAERLVK